jgi:hypothetical protein
MKIGRTIYDAGATRRTVAEALKERDLALGWKCYTNRSDADKQYQNIADKLEVEGRNLYIPIHPNGRNSHSHSRIGDVNVNESENGSSVVYAPKDMVGWTQQHPYLQTSNPEPVTVGGVKGVQFDVVLGDRPQNYIGTCTSIVGQPNCVDLFKLSTGGQIFVAEGDKSASPSWRR